MDKKSFEDLKNEVDEFLDINSDNVMSKSIGISKFHNKLLKHYLKENKKLKSINTNKDKVYSHLYHKYKYEYYYKLDTKK